MSLQVFSALLGTIRYNRDWPRYLYARLVALEDDGVLLTFRLRNGQVVTLRSSMRPVLNEIYLHRVYDIPAVDLASCRQVFDFGANMGIFAMYVTTRAPRATISCFEPASSNFALLEQNLAANRVPARAYRLAVSTRCGVQRLQLTGVAGEYALGDADGDSEVVECVDLARVFELAEASECDFLKMDVEGEELPILRETPTDVLRRVRAMAVEWHHGVEPLKQVCSRLGAVGFQTSVHSVGQETILKAWQP